MAFNFYEHHDEEGEHDEDECELCVERNHTVSCDRRCGRCCRHSIIETSLRDAQREPRINELPIVKGVTDEVEGHLLNGEDGPCVFFDREQRLCTIYETRPLVCRLFDCERAWTEEERAEDDELDLR